MTKALDYKDISLVPRVVSTLTSRKQADTSIKCFGIELEVPMIASPMPDVCNGEMAWRLAGEGALGIIHRFQSIDEQLAQYCITDTELRSKMACAIGASGDYQERFHHLYGAGCRIFCIDTANGANEQVGKAITWIKSLEYVGAPIERVYIIAGNVASAEGFRYLADLGVDAVRVGIAGGSVCETKTETGVYVPMVTSIMECVGEASKCDNPPLIIADGGIKTPADMCKILAVGADLVICGSIFAGTDESPGKIINDNGRFLKLYRGAASFGVQEEYNDREPDYVEGRESFVPYKGKVSKVIKRFKNGLASSMSYMNARTLDEFVENSHFIRIS